MLLQLSHTQYAFSEGGVAVPPGVHATSVQPRIGGPTPGSIRACCYNDAPSLSLRGVP